MGLLVTSCQGQPMFMGSADKSNSPPPTPPGDVVPSSFLVMFRGEKAQSSLYFSSFFEEYQHHYVPLSEELLSDPRVKSIDILTTEDLSPLNDTAGWAPDFDAPAAMQLFWQENPEDSIPGVLTRVDFSSDEHAKQVLKEWEIQGRTWYAEPNGISRPSADSIWTTYKTNYESAAISWHRNIELVEAFNSISENASRRSDNEVTAAPPLIAVLDSGVDFEHPQLKDDKLSAIWENNSPGASGCDNDRYGCNTTAPSKGSLGNGDVWPVGASGPNQSVSGEGKHGTHVAGLIAAKLDSDRGVGGVCPVCQIMIVKVASIDSDSPTGTPGISDDSQIRGLKYVTRFKTNNSNAVRIVNSSFGKYTRSRSVSILVDALKKTGNGTLVIAAASNEDSMIRSYPAALANAVAVSALDGNNKKAAFSNFGPWVDVAAPGVELISTVPGGEVGPSSGTSMAAPVVAGAAGLYLALNPDASFDTVRSKILDCADGKIYTANSDGAKFNAAHYFPQISGEEVRRPLLGSGIVNVNNMIKGTCANSVGRPLDRVTPGCSTISGGIEGSPVWLLLALLFLPLGLTCVRRRQA